MSETDSLIWLQDNDTLKDLLKANLEREISMTVYSSKTRTVSPAET
jgi:hypothetical protein